MNDCVWSLFIQTGNIETYLLLKEIENEHQKGMIENKLLNEQVISIEARI